jgi:hypothetical protein
MVDEAGYLRGDLDDLAAKLGAPRSLIDKVLDDYKLPRGLAYLPVIESAYISSRVFTPRLKKIM